MVKKIVSKVYLLLILLFLYAPIFFLVIFSFNDSRLKSTWVGFTLKWYQELFNNRMIISSFRNTLLIAVLTTILATIIGTLAAIGIHHLGRWKKTVTLQVNQIPVLNPDIVTAIALMVVFHALHFQFGFATMLLAHLSFTIPYVVLSVLPKLQQLDPNLLEAAADLGAKPGYILRHILLPEIKPGILSGALLGFTLSMDDFVVSYFNTGNGFNNLSITVFSMAKKGINPAINALSTIMFSVILILLVVVYFQTKKSEKRKEVE